MKVFFFCKELWKEMPKRIFLSKNKMIFFIKKSLYLKYLKMSCNLINGVFITHNSQSKIEDFFLRHSLFIHGNLLSIDDKLLCLA